MYYSLRYTTRSVIVIVLLRSTHCSVEYYACSTQRKFCSTHCSVTALYCNGCVIVITKLYFFAMYRSYVPSKLMEGCSRRHVLQRSIARFDGYLMVPNRTSTWETLCEFSLKETSLLMEVPCLRKYHISWKCHVW